MRVQDHPDSLRGYGPVGSVLLEMHAEVDFTTLTGNAMIVPVGTTGKWPQRIKAPIHVALTRVAGNHFHDGLKQLTDFEKLAADIVYGDPRNPVAFGNVVFINGNRPLARSLEAALQAADDARCQVVILPMLGYADTPAQWNDKKFLQTIHEELVLVLESFTFSHLKVVRVVHPSGPNEVDCLPAAQRKRLAAAAEAAKAKTTPVEEQLSPERQRQLQVAVANHQAAEEEERRSGVPLQVELGLGPIDALPLQASVATIPSFGDPTKMAITRELVRIGGGMHYFDGLAKLGKVTDGATFLVEGSDDTAFEKVIFVGNDGGLSIEEYVVAALSFAEKCGLEYVGLPALAFLRNDQLTEEGLVPTEQLWADVFNAIKSGIYTFTQIPGRKSLKFLLVTMPDLPPQEAAVAEQQAEN